MLSAVQYGIVTVGKKQVGAGPVAKEAFDPLGSWTLTFGLTSCALNALVILILRLVHRSSSLPLPSLRLGEVWLPASSAGLCYALSVLCTTLAVEGGGNAVVLAQRNAISLVTSGAWALLWYQEVRGWAAVGWAASALLTMVSIVLLGFEKAG